MSDGHIRALHPNYRKPPVEHQFKQGQSGNPRGRPIKRERSLTNLQVMRDILAVTNSKIRIRTADGPQQVTMYEALLLKLVQRGLEGHGPSIRFAILLHEQTVRAHEQRYDKYFPMLDQLEHHSAIYPPAKEYKNANEARLNVWRKDTQRV